MNTLHSLEGYRNQSFAIQILAGVVLILPLLLPVVEVASTLTGTNIDVEFDKTIRSESTRVR